MTTIRYVATPKSSFKTVQGKCINLLWGDPVHILDETGGRVHGYARGNEGWMAADDLCDHSLLELYVIDVGQGTGVLIKTPDGQWHLVDAGIANEKQMTRKGVINFLRWKFEEDLRLDRVALANVILSHPDDDHYGGLLDLFSGKIYSSKLGRTRLFNVEVANFYHNGLGRFAADAYLGQTVAGEAPLFPQGKHGIQPQGKFITELLDDRESFVCPPRPFKGEFAKLAVDIGRIPHKAARLTTQTCYLPGFAPGDNNVTIHVLGPILESCGVGQCGLRLLSSSSQTVNGHSIVLRLDYGSARILLPGDLNKKGQQLLLSYQPSELFLADVAIGCHHGAEDVDLNFLRAIHAHAMVFSSGDNEDYNHPRPLSMGAAGHYGRACIAPNGAVMPPLVYSTELARSIRLAYAAQARMKIGSRRITGYSDLDPKQVQVLPDLKSDAKVNYRGLPTIAFAADLIYGLVNIRTDGVRILCATMAEKGNDFDVKIFKAGV